MDDKSKKALSLCIAVAVATGGTYGAHRLYKSMTQGFSDDEKAYYSNISAGNYYPHSHFGYFGNYYYTRGSSFASGTWSKSTGFSGSSYSTSRAGGISG